MFIIPHEADFECPEGHKFIAPVSANSSSAEVRCPYCYEAWVAKHVPHARQQTPPRVIEAKAVPC